MEDSQELLAAREQIAAMMERARAAQAQIADYTQEQVSSSPWRSCTFSTAWRSRSAA